MSSPWGKIAAPVEAPSFADIMSEEYANHLNDVEVRKIQRICDTADVKKRDEAKASKMDENSIWGKEDGINAANVSYSEAAKQQMETVATMDDDWEDFTELLKQEAKAAVEDGETLPAEVVQLLDQYNRKAICDSDAVIAQMMQSQYDNEFNEELRRIEEKQNKHSKVSISLEKYRRNGDLEFLTEPDNQCDEEQCPRSDWDRFETNAKILETIPKCGFMMDKEGEMITKHDEQLCGVRNACRVMSFPPEFSTGDGAGFDMKLSNQVFNQLKTYSQRGCARNTKKNKMQDRKEFVATTEMGMDGRTRLLLYKLINNQILKKIDGIISTGKEAVILHATIDPNFSYENKIGVDGYPQYPPKECAIKVYKTTLNEFKQRDRYIKDDYRFKDRFSKQNNREFIKMWAEKEKHNLIRMKKAGIRCPDVVVHKEHVLVMSFLGCNSTSTKLKYAPLCQSQIVHVYEEIVGMMHSLYNKANLVHADLSEYNILVHCGQYWFIDVAQAVETTHPNALEFLMRDCANIINFFSKCGVDNISTEKLFQHITRLDAEYYNASMLERINARGASVLEATAPNNKDCPDEFRPIEFPFDLAWEKSQADKLKRKEQDNKTNVAANTLQVLSINCSAVAAVKEAEIKSNMEKVEPVAVNH